MGTIFGLKILDPLHARMDRFGFLQNPKRFLEEGISFLSEFDSTPIPVKNTSRPSAFSPTGFSWLVDGVPLLSECDFTRVPTDDEWETLLSSENPDLSKIEGHYVAFRWSQGKFDIFNDRMGLRTIFLKVVDGFLVFSTDLKALCQKLNLQTINSFGFASHWLTFNQLNYDALVKGVTKLGPGGRARVRNNKLEIDFQLWNLGRDITNEDENLESVLRPYVNPRIDSRKIYLSLSGGVDSRCLACLLQVQNPSYTLYTFGDESDADVRIARVVGKALRRTHLYLGLSDSDGYDLWDGLQDYVSRTHCATPFTGYLTISTLTKLDLDSAVLLDGGFGEIGRRQFLNRLVWKRKLRGGTWGSFEEIAQSFSHHRGSIFRPEIEAGFRSIVLRDIQQIWKEADNYEPEDFADLLAVRYRLPNWYGYEQARLDDLTICFMPFAQPIVVEYLLAQKPGKRASGKILKKAIRDAQAGVHNIPYVKGGIPYPAWLKGITSNLYVLIRQRLNQQPADDPDKQLTAAIKDRIMGSLESPDFRAFEAYNHAEIEQSVRGYFDGDTRQERRVIWWFSFETWRRCLGLEAVE